MNREDTRRRQRLVRLGICGAVLAALVTALAAIPAVDRNWAKELATSRTPLHEPQETSMDRVQEPPYVAALVVCAVMVVRLWRRPDRLPYWVLLAAMVAWLLWRELPWDERILGANTFSWAKYLKDPAVPLLARVGLGGGSIAVTVALIGYFVWRRRALGRLIRERLFSPSTVFVVLAGLALVAAQMADKHRSVDKFLGVSLSAWDLKDYLEESLELVGPVLLVMACILAAMEEPRPERPS
ncbi:MAG TPA: hypothetical protein VM431_05270 [Phycisphaerae bacterium]|nr:hypothetical protein [Phycisphaerae bacterium]